MSAATESVRPVVPRAWPAHLTLPMLLGGIALLAYAPLLLRLGQRMWNTDHYQHFPLIIVGAIVLAWQRLRDTDVRHTFKPGHPVTRAAFWTPTLLALVAAILLDSPFLAGVSLLGAIWSSAFSLGGMPLFKKILPAWIFLLFAMPWPMGLDEEVVQVLQLRATAWASSVLDLFGFHHLVAGVTIEMPGGHQFLVEEACSGIHSLFAALSCTLFYMLLSRRGGVRSAIILLVGVFWVLVANATRVTLVCILGSETSIPVTEGWTHDAFGMFVFVLSLLLIYSTDRLFLYIVPARESRLPRTNSEPSNRKVPSRRGWNRMEFLGLAGVFGLCAFAGFASGGWSGKTLAGGSAGTFKPLDENVLPADFKGWKRINHEIIERKKTDRNGRFSQQWRYQKGDTEFVVSVDGPFIGWHNLAGCLRGQGWEVLSKSNKTTENAAGGHSEMKVDRGGNRFGFVIWSCFDSDHRRYTPPDSYVGFRAARRFPELSEIWKRFTGGEEAARARDDAPSYQIHLIVQTATPASAELQAEMQTIFRDAESRLSKAAPQVVQD